MHDNGQVGLLQQLKDGKRDGLDTHWYSNGQKKAEGNFKDGKVVSAVVWKPNGEKCPVTYVEDGAGVVVNYNENGTEDFRVTIKDSEIDLESLDLESLIKGFKKDSE